MPSSFHAVQTRDSYDEFLSYDLELLWSLAALETCLYGAYFVMFAFYVHILRASRIAGHRFLAIVTIALFILCTIHCALVLAATILGTRLMMDSGNERSFKNFALAAEAVYVTTNVIADGIFIFRCYAIWNSRLKIVIFPIFMTLTVAGFGYFTIIDAGADSNTPELAQLIRAKPFFAISIAISLLTTFVLMMLTVGRIWSLARAARRVMGEKVASRYRTVCAMILKSGALYFIGGLAVVILGFIPRTGTGIGRLLVELSGTILGQLVGIAPTIIAVRVGLGYSVESVDSLVASTPRTRFVSQLPAAHQLEVDAADEILYIRPVSAKVETV